MVCFIDTAPNLIYTLSLHDALPISQVGVTPGNADRGVDDGRDLAPDQFLGAHAVQVGVVDDGDLAGVEALGDVLRPAIYARDSHNAGWLARLPPGEQRNLHGRRLHRVPSCQSDNAPMAMLALRRVIELATERHHQSRGVPQGTT